MQRNKPEKTDKMHMERMENHVFGRNISERLHTRYKAKSKNKQKQRNKQLVTLIVAIHKTKSQSIMLCVLCVFCYGILK